MVPVFIFKTANLFLNIYVFVQVVISLKKILSLQRKDGESQMCVCGGVVVVEGLG